jgi:hypothetical protein
MHFFKVCTFVQNDKLEKPLGNETDKWMGPWVNRKNYLFKVLWKKIIFILQIVLEHNKS